MSDKDLDGLYEAILSISTKEECKLFLEDLLSMHELESLSARVASARLLMQGKTYLETIAETKISSATLARVSKCVKYGKGYLTVLGKPAKKK